MLMADIVVVVVMSSFVLNKVNTIKESVRYLLSVLDVSGKVCASNNSQEDSQADS